MPDGIRKGAAFKKKDLIIAPSSTYYPRIQVIFSTFATYVIN